MGRGAPRTRRRRRLDGLRAGRALSKVLETTDRARGHLYGFHQLTGSADFDLGEAVRLLREAGHDEQAARLRVRVRSGTRRLGRSRPAVRSDQPDCAGRLAPAVSPARRLDLHPHSAWSPRALLRLWVALRRPADRRRARPARRSQRPPSAHPITTACPSSSARGAAPSGTRCRRPPRPRSRPRGPVRPGPAGRQVRPVGPAGDRCRGDSGQTDGREDRRRTLPCGHEVQYSGRQPAADRYLYQNGMYGMAQRPAAQQIAYLAQRDRAGLPAGDPDRRDPLLTDRSIRSRVVSHHVDAVSRAEAFPPS